MSVTTSAPVVDHYDIGELLNAGIKMRNLERDDKYKILKCEHTLDPSCYPRTRASASAPYRQFQPSWLTKYPWLHYSRFCDGVFCRACVFFAPKIAGGQTLGQFVTKPFRSWVNHTQKMNAHSGFEYHLTACSTMKEFLHVYEHPSHAIDTRLISQAQEQVEENKQVIVSLFKIVMLLGKQGVPFRGHRDDRVVFDSDTEDEITASNQGNFIEMVETEQKQMKFWPNT